MTMAYHRYHDVDTKIVRIFNTYGPRMRLHDGRVVPAFIGEALTGKPLTIFGDGSQTRSFCYVSDLIDGIFRLAMSDFHEPVNIGNPREMTIKQFADEIIRIVPERIHFYDCVLDHCIRGGVDLSAGRGALAAVKRRAVV